MQGEASVTQLILVDGQSAAHLACAAGMIPAPGQYVLAYADGSTAPLAMPIFAAGGLPDGFLTAPPIPSTWGPGTRLHMRGPLGHGFSLPMTARRVALAALDCSPRVLLSLLQPALQRGASVTLVGANIPDNLPLQVEAQPLEALEEVCKWADFVALDIPRETLPAFRDRFAAQQTTLKAEAQVLVRTPMPCGALAACGVCSVEAGKEMLLACDDGPVFELRQLMGWSRRA